MSNAPNPRKRRPKPAFDVDAIEVEISGEPFKFKFGGTTYEVPAIIDFRLGPPLAQGEFGAVIEMMVGPEQWAQIMASPAVLTLDRAAAIVQAFTVHVGSTAGKSPASTRSS